MFFYETLMIASLCCTGEEEVAQANVTMKNACDLKGILVDYQLFSGRKKYLEDNLTYQQHNPGRLPEVLQDRRIQ